MIINNSINHGTQIPYIKRAQELGYSILITNTNDNYRTINGVRTPIKGLSSATSHATYVWENLVMLCNPESVAIVAHSAGGAVTLDLVCSEELQNERYFDNIDWFSFGFQANRFPAFFKEKVFGIAFTDSVHLGYSKSVKSVLANKICNWASSSSPLDTPLGSESAETDIRMVSAGKSLYFCVCV